MIKISVCYVNGQKGMVDAEDLDMLIKARKIISFRRSSGWVRVALDQIRGQGGEDYSGSDRRNFSIYQQMANLRYIFTTNEINKHSYMHRKFMNRIFRHYDYR
ncbi:hypothetical protein OR1_01617 [Geobacter sp. OR-1]|uniref:GSU3473 family protein n=1 Tax=Geobacter sp. OR-1 TaxID=1266765 RepID=UPI0005424A7E|nr:hypothetical protein [Geobacter sp. OR-1]GAM09342.1 hypothetical protein OR1_01617 [Geobacter sp. OR-1]